MKLKAILLSLLLVSPMAFAWEKIGPIYTIYGTKIDQSKPELVEPFAELAYHKETDSFGISFISSKGERKLINNAVFNMRTCDTNTMGAISGTELIDIPTKDQMDNIFIDCNRPILFRIWDMSNEHVTYKFENAGPLPE